MYNLTLKKSLSFFIVLAECISIIFGVFPYLNHNSQVHADFTTSYVTLKNGRLSFRSKLSSAVTSGGTSVAITTSSQPDIDTLNLFPADLICFTNPFDTATTNGCTNRLSYTVASRAGDNQTVTTSAGVTGGVGVDSEVVASQSGQILVNFTASQAVPASGGTMKIKIPAANTSGKATDGMPDQIGWDAGELTNANIATYMSISPSVSGLSYALSYDSTNFLHVITITTTTTAIAAATAYTITIGDPSNTNFQFINPAPCATCNVGSTHTRGKADSYSVALESYNTSAVLLESVTLGVAPNDGVLVSANVPLIMQYTIAGIAAGSGNACANDGGATTFSNTTTATLASYGTSITSPRTLYTIGQSHTIITNAPSGYSLVVYANRQLTHTDGSTTIPATVCSTGSPCSLTSTFSAWTSGTGAADSGTGSYGFGFATSTSAGYIPFGTSFANAVTVLTGGGTTSGTSTNTCYRISVAGSQKAGLYTATLTYIATPKF